MQSACLQKLTFGQFQNSYWSGHKIQHWSTCLQRTRGESWRYRTILSPCILLNYICISWFSLLSSSHGVMGLQNSTPGCSHAYHAPYKPRHRYWTGLLLVIRSIMFLSKNTNSSDKSYSEWDICCGLIPSTPFWWEPKSLFTTSKFHVVRSCRVSSWLQP